MADVFLSYSTKNRDFILRLKHDLERLNYTTWMDNQGIKGGDEWVKEIDENLGTCSIFLVAVSRDSNQSNWVRRETIRAEQLGKKRIPLLLDDSDMPFHLLDVQYIDCRSWNGKGAWKIALSKLDAVLRKHLPSCKTTKSKKRKQQHHQSYENKKSPSPSKRHRSSLESSSCSSTSMVCGNCHQRLTRDKFSTKQWEKGRSIQKQQSSSNTLEESKPPAEEEPPQEPPPTPSFFGNFFSGLWRTLSGGTPAAASTTPAACTPNKQGTTTETPAAAATTAGSETKEEEDNNNNQKKRKLIYCRRCEEKLMVKHQLTPELEKQCTRIYISTKGGGGGGKRQRSKKFLAAVVPVDAITQKQQQQQQQQANNDNTHSNNNMSSFSTPTAGKSKDAHSFLPKDLTLDGYTRAEWSLANNTVGWETTTLVAVVASNGMMDFLKFLKQHEKAAYGRFVTNNKHTNNNNNKKKQDGFLCIPFDQPILLSTSMHNDKDIDNDATTTSTSTATTTTSGTKQVEVLCKYAFGLGLVEREQGGVGGPTSACSSSSFSSMRVPAGAATATAAVASSSSIARGSVTTTTMESESCPYSPARDPEEDYVSSSMMLGSLLSAQRKTDQTLATIPRNSVHQANTNTAYIQSSGGVFSSSSSPSER